MKKGLVLEGGAMKGLFSAGVLDVFMENEICFDEAVGVSAGAVFGCNYKSRQIGRVIRYNKRFCGDKRYASWSSFFKTGDLYGVDFCYHKLPWELDLWDQEAYEANPMKFIAVVTDVNTGRAKYKACKKGDERDIEWFRASASVPLVSRIVKLGKGKYLDGGIADSVPFEFFESKDFERIVVIQTKPLGYRKKFSVLLSLGELFRYIKYPKFLKACFTRHTRYNRAQEHLDLMEKMGKVFVIRPPQLIKVSSVPKDPEELERIYQMGRAEGVKQLDKLKEFLLNQDMEG